MWLMLLWNENWRKKKWLIWSLCGVVLLLNHMKCVDKNVIRFSIFSGVITILRRLRRLVQMMALITVIAFMTLVLYQNVHGLKDLEVISFNWLHWILSPHAKTPNQSNQYYFSIVFINFFYLATISIAIHRVAIDFIEFDRWHEWTKIHKCRCRGHMANN